MKVLAITLGRSSRPRHDDHFHHTTGKDDSRGLIEDRYFKKNEDGMGQRSTGKSTLSRNGQDLSDQIEDNKVESSHSLIYSPQNEAKSARVIRVPRETMSAHRSKLVRNSSINKWRAKFRRPPLTSETTTETDTEQLLDETEKTHKTTSKPERKGRDTTLSKENSRDCNPSPSENDNNLKKRDKCINYINNTKSKNHTTLSSNKTGTNGMTKGVEWESSSSSNMVQQEWSSSPPPRSVTPHRVQLRGEFIPWVGSISQRDSDNPRYLPMSRGHVSLTLSTPQSVGGSSAICQKSLSSTVKSFRDTQEEHVSSWPRVSRATKRNAVEGVYKAPSELCPRDLCPPSPASDLVRSNTASGSNSHFGTFPRRRLSQKDACGTSEAAQLEQRLRSLGCELVTLRSRLPPSLHHSRPTTPPAPIINTTTNTTTLTASSANSSFHTANNSNNNSNNKNNTTNPSNTQSAQNTGLTSPSTTTTTNNNKNVQTHNGTVPLPPINYPVGGGGTPSSGGSESRITLNSSNLVDGLNSSQSFLADVSCVKGGMTGGVQEVEDLIHLAGPLTEDAVLKTLHARFCSSHYFTNVGPILLSVNPYHEVGNALTLTSTRAAVQSPHLLRVVHEAVRQQSETGYPQAIILSGASGSGKTYTSMLLLRQLFDVAGGGPETDAFKHLAAAFTVLRSLGSAKTTSNSESSRIGHFIEVQVTDGALYRTKIHCYFLDQTRVVRPLPDEKNYHIFYQMLAGLTQEERAKLHLEGHSVRTLRYLSEGDVRQDEVEDARRFEAWKACLGVLGIPFLDVVRVLAAVLLLGNVTFIEGQGLNGEGEGLHLGPLAPMILCTGQV